MEKLVYLIAKHDAEDCEAFSKNLRGPAAERLLANGVHKLQINVADEAVAPAAPLRQVNSSAPFDGMLSLWVDYSWDHLRVEEIFKPHLHRYVGYLVTESERIPNTAQCVSNGQRTPGFSQVCTLQVPPRLSYDAWLNYWQNEHSALAIETQSTFRYVQNIVVRRLTWDAPTIHAIVEECFPEDAMENPQAFYDAIGDEAKYQRNFQRMIDSCMKFIDFDKMDVIETSEYVMKS